MSWTQIVKCRARKEQGLIAVPPGDHTAANGSA